MSAKRFVSTSLLSAALLSSASFAQSTTATMTGGSAAAGGTLICADQLVDQFSGSCIQASSLPGIGMLYPLSVDFFISSATGSVGLGTTNPAKDLHVVGEGRFQLPGNARIDMERSGDDAIITGASVPGFEQRIAFTNNGLSLRANGTNNDFNVTESGNVGVGTTSPISDFDIENLVWMAGSPFGLGEGVIMTRHPTAMRAAYVGPFSTTQYTIGMHDNSGLFVTGGILHDATTDETSIYGDVKNFRETNPRDPSTDIVYACVEGPEAAAYVRGTADLIGGMAHIELPEHFSDVAVNQGMTVQVSPRSANSLGLAVIERSTTHIVVKELLQGRGNYQIDWEVKAVRTNYQDYKVVRPKLRSPELLPVQPQRY